MITQEWLAITEVTTAANGSDIKDFTAQLEKAGLKQGTSVMADFSKNPKILTGMKLKSRIKLWFTERERAENMAVRKVRYAVELVIWFDAHMVQANQDARVAHNGGNLLKLYRTS